VSSISFTVIPAACSAVIADSRPEPGPLTRTSISFTPNLAAFSAACCAAICPAKGVLLRDPLKLQVPALAQHNVSPRMSVIVTCVLLKVALMKAMAVVTLRRTLRRLFAASCLFCCLATILSCFVLSYVVQKASVGFRWRSTPRLDPPQHLRVAPSLSHNLARTQSMAANKEISTSSSVEDYRKSLTPFLPATVFRGPFRVRALVRVR
jgi:hypothetical protein